jgi:hypothetical protein
MLEWVELLFVSDGLLYSNMSLCRLVQKSKLEEMKGAGSAKY